VIAGLAACGGTRSGSEAHPSGAVGLPGAASGTVFEVSADPAGRLRFDKPKLVTTTGRVTITMDNPSLIAHGIALEGSGVHVTGAVVGHLGSSQVTASLRRGRYT